MAIKVASRGLVPPFMVMDVMRDAARLEAEGRRIVHLEVGQPSTGLPAAAAARVRELVGRDALGYTVASGLPQLRARIAAHYAKTYGTDIDPARIFATTGSSGGFLLAFLAAFEPGDRVALAAPGYPAYRHILTAVGVERSTGEVWMALGNNLLHFDKEGNRRATYKIYTPQEARLEANTILVEDDRLIIGSDPLGIYEFARPDKKSQE